MDLTGILTDSNYSRLDEISNDYTNTQALESQELGQDTFLTLLTTELQYQDPLEPMDNKDMIAQMAQFSSVEQLTAIEENSSSTNEIMTAMMATLENVVTKLESITDVQETNEDTNYKLDELKEEQEKLYETNLQIIEELQKLNSTMAAYGG